MGALSLGAMLKGGMEAAAQAQASKFADDLASAAEIDAKWSKRANDFSKSMI